MLIPHTGSFLAHFNEPPARNVIYADITTTPEFGLVDDGWVVAAVDMDLDVVRADDGRTWIEDQDEFTEHADSLGYSADLIASSELTADSLLAAVREKAEPFASVWKHWIKPAERVTCRLGESQAAELQAWLDDITTGSTRRT